MRIGSTSHELSLKVSQRRDEAGDRSTPRRATKLLAVLFAWLAVHVIVIGLFMLFGIRLESQPPAVRALVAVAVLVLVMAHVRVHSGKRE